MVLRSLYGSFVIGGKGPEAFHPFYRTLTAVKTTARYLLISAFPLKPVPYYEGSLAKDPFDPSLLAALGLLFASGLGLVWARRRSRTAFFGAIWFFVTLLPASHLLPIPGSREVPMADRHLYLPSVGLSIVLAAGLDGVARWAAGRFRVAPQRVAAALLLVPLGLYVPATLAWSRIWRDDVSLYGHMVRTSPFSADVHVNLGSAYFKQGRYLEAKAALEKAIRLQPNFGAAYAILAKVYDAQGRHQEALDLFRKAYAVAPNDLRTIIYLGTALVKRGYLDEGILLLERAVQSEPYLAQVHNILGLGYWRRGEIEKAVLSFERSKAISPDDIAPRYSLGLLYAGQKRYQEAIQEFQEALRIEEER